MQEVLLRASFVAPATVPVNNGVPSAATSADREKLVGIMQACVGHFVSPITLPKVILSYLSTYDER